MANETWKNVHYVLCKRRVGALTTGANASKCFWGPICRSMYTGNEGDFGDDFASGQLIATSSGVQKTCKKQSHLRTNVDPSLLENSQKNYIFRMNHAGPF